MARRQVEGHPHDGKIAIWAGVPALDKASSDALERERSSVQSSLAWLEDWTIKSADDLAWAETCAREAGARWKALEEKRKTITVPIDTAKRGVQALFKPTLDALEKVGAVLRSKIVEADRAKRASDAAAMAAAAEAARAGDTEGCSAAIAQLAPMVHAPGVSIVERWAWRVVDESAIPREYLSVDADKVNAVKPSKGEQPPEIPGIEWYKDASARIGK